ncbi:hypothetical protein [Acinetobacter baumannii]
MRHCKNAYYRLALTGTPFMRESQESNMRLMSLFRTDCHQGYGKNAD